MTEPVAGKSILDLLWEAMDGVVDRLQEEGQPIEWEQVHAGRRALRAVREWGEKRGQAQGLAYALAVIINPYEPDVAAIKREAMARWEARPDD